MLQPPASLLLLNEAPDVAAAQVGLHNSGGLCLKPGSAETPRSAEQNQLVQ